MQVYYYFTTLRAIVIFPDGDKKNTLIKRMEKMNECYDAENAKYNNLITKNIKNYPNVNKLIEIIKYSQDNATPLIKDPICLHQSPCELYLSSIANIFDSGVDFTFKTTMTEINNIWMNFKQLDSQSDIRRIVGQLLISSNQFTYIAISLNSFYVFVLKSILINFDIDQGEFITSSNSFITILNMISIIFSIFVLLFVIIFIFISISNFTNPIKDSAYRINFSLF